MVKQGDIIKVNINPQAGHERAGYRLALVITNDFFNQKANVAVVCPITNTDNSPVWCAGSPKLETLFYG